MSRGIYPGAGACSVTPRSAQFKGRFMGSSGSVGGRSIKGSPPFQVLSLVDLARAGWAPRRAPQSARSARPRSTVISGICAPRRSRCGARRLPGRRQCGGRAPMKLSPQLSWRPLTVGRSFGAAGSCSCLSSSPRSFASLRSTRLAAVLQELAIAGCRHTSM